MHLYYWFQIFFDRKEIWSIVFVHTMLYLSNKRGHWNNISVILWRSVLLVEETEVPGEKSRPVANHWQTLSHNVVSSTSRLRGIRTHSALMGQVVVNPTIIRSRPRRSLSRKNDNNKMINKAIFIKQRQNNNGHGYGVLRHFHQYFSYIVADSFIGVEDHRHAASQWQTLAHNVVWSTPRHVWDLSSQHWFFH